MTCFAGSNKGSNSEVQSLSSFQSDSGDDNGKKSWTWSPGAASASDAVVEKKVMWPVSFLALLMGSCACSPGFQAAPLLGVIAEGGSVELQLCAGLGIQPEADKVPLDLQQCILFNLVCDGTALFQMMLSSKQCSLYFISEFYWWLPLHSTSNLYVIRSKFRGNTPFPQKWHLYSFESPLWPFGVMAFEESIEYDGPSPYKNVHTPKMLHVIPHGWRTSPSCELMLTKRLLNWTSRAEEAALENGLFSSRWGRVAEMFTKQQEWRTKTNFKLSCTEIVGLPVCHFPIYKQLAKIEYLLIDVIIRPTNPCWVSSVCWTQCWTLCIQKPKMKTTLSLPPGKCRTRWAQKP